MSFRTSLWFIILFLGILPGRTEGQETSYFPGYQTILSGNPGYTGCGDEGVLRITYLNFLPGKSYNFHTAYLSYDSYFNEIHGGAGLYISNDYLGGIVNDLRGGLSYAYFLRAGKDLYINAGLSAAFFHRGFNFSDVVFPDQIDALGNVSLPSGEIPSDENSTVLDIGTGFVFSYRHLTGGFSVSHLTRPSPDRERSEAERLDRKYSINLTGDILPDNNTGIIVRPVAAMEIQGNFFTAGAGAVVTRNSLSGNMLFIYNNNRNLNLQAGFSFRNENITLFYNYRFNISSHNTLMPFSLMHQTGLLISLNKVEKRIKNGTIFLPVI